ncbi:PDR/VanB family oxidoreductase [Nocardioides bruguierae]|uniref:PDR/VanB family oxidoreductase n=1 Tax=Nocardioides bruguierae TaxID=2945102 RepID=A0A9X2D8H8_9ACTN|nr:PDR/VanB family oxidoreductase [Nocardioides bruguierae]MCM0620762.1 PDR/VanB family oxidoreductase [Nocardioides bruguierae]
MSAERIALVVTGLTALTPSIREVVLAPIDGGSLPSYAPGSHLVLDVPVGDGRERALANAYSLTGETVEPTEYRISVLRCDPADGAAGGSAWVHTLAVGDKVEALPPRNLFAPVRHATKHLLVGAGIGITPLLSHLRSHVRWDADVELLHVCREGEGAHVDEVVALTGGAATVVHDRATFAALLAERVRDQPLGTHLYTCGPTGFMDLVHLEAAAAGWPAERVHAEAFGAADLDPGAPFTVGVAGEEIEVPSGVSLLEALEEAGHEVPNLCRQGVCGECRVPVASGSTPVLHRDLYLTDEDKAANDCLMACVSRALPTDDRPAHLEVTL